MKRLATKSLLAGFILLAQLAFFAAVCYGETGTNAPGSSLLDSPPDTMFANTSGDSFSMMVKVIFFLIVIIVIFLAIMKIISKKNNILFGRSIRSLGGLPLGQNKSIQVVEIGKSLYIVGVGDNVQLLEKIEDEAEVAIITEQMTSSAASNVTFETIGGLLNKWRKKRQDEEEIDYQSESFQQVFQSNMQKVADRKKLMEDLLKQDNSSERLNDKS